MRRKVIQVCSTSTGAHREAHWMCSIGHVLQHHQEIQVKLVHLPWIGTEDSACLCFLLQRHIYNPPGLRSNFVRCYWVFRTSFCLPQPTIKGCNRKEQSDPLQCLKVRKQPCLKSSCAPRSPYWVERKNMNTS